MVPLANRKWLLEKYAYKIRSNPHYPINALKQDIRTENVLDISRSTVYRMRKDAKAKLLGNEKEQYKMLWSYCAEIMRSNPGAHVL